MTLRCQEEDLTSTDFRAYAGVFVEKFLDQRGKAPDGGEGISGLRERPCKSLHMGRYRGITWHDLRHDIVWLLAAHIHRDDSQEDSYAAAIEHERAGRLYPTADDYAASARARVQEEEVEQIRAEAAALMEIRDLALHAPGTTHRYASLGDLYVEMRAEVEPELALLTVRVRIFRRSNRPIFETEMSIFLEAVFADALPLDDRYREIGDSDGRFRQFEGFFALL